MAKHTLSAIRLGSSAIALTAAALSAPAFAQAAAPQAAQAAAQQAAAPPSLPSLTNTGLRGPTGARRGASHGKQPGAVQGGETLESEKKNGGAVFMARARAWHSISLSPLPAPAPPPPRQRTWEATASASTPRERTGGDMETGGRAEGWPWV